MWLPLYGVRCAHTWGSVSHPSISRGPPCAHDPSPCCCVAGLDDVLMPCCLLTADKITSPKSCSWVSAAAYTWRESNKKKINNNFSSSRLYLPANFPGRDKASTPGQMPRRRAVWPEQSTPAGLSTPKSHLIPFTGPCLLLCLDLTCSAKQLHLVDPRSARLTVGLADLRGLSQSKWFNDAVSRTVC